MTPGEAPQRTATVRMSRPSRAPVIVALCLALAGCAAATTITKHGAQLQDSDLAQVQPGMTQDSVANILGTPATTTTLQGGAVFYYISSTMSQTAFFSPTEIDRRVIAVYFTQAGLVDRVAHYGMKDGKVFDFISRTTPSANTREEGLLKQLFRNLGKGTSIFGNE